MLVEIIRDFGAELESQIGNLIGLNPHCNPEVVKFTYNFSELERHLCIAKNSYYKLRRDRRLSDPELYNKLITNIDDKLIVARGFAIQGGIYVSLVGRETVFVDQNGEGPVVFFCLCELSEVAEDAEKFLDMLCKDMYGTEKKSISIIEQKVRLLLQHCLDSIDVILGLPFGAIEDPPIVAQPNIDLGCHESSSSLSRIENPVIDPCVIDLRCYESSLE